MVEDFFQYLEDEIKLKCMENLRILNTEKVKKSSNC